MKHTVTVMKSDYHSRFLNPKLWFLVILMVLFSGGVIAQDKKAMISEAEKTQVIDSLAMHLEKDYVFEDIGAKIAKLLRHNLVAGNYEKFNDPKSFAAQLNEDLRSVNNDMHLRLYYDPERIKQERDAALDDADAQKAIARQRQIANYGFKEVKILPGNVGYLKFNSFDGTDEGLKVAIGAMAFMANCDALIFDIRENGGGDPRMVQLLLSYLYAENDDVHINDFYVRKTNDYNQYWVMPYCPGKRMPTLDVYVLTSSYTFSCAEEFAYDLKNLKRATLVGETTGGGAHPIEMYVLNDNFAASIPFGRAVNPISKTNWEGVGVEPDVKSGSKDALDSAYKLALDKMMAKETDKDAKYVYQWALDGLKASQPPVQLSKQLMQSYAGVYGVRTITYENGKLFYQREGREKMQMLPLTNDYFWFKEVDYFRLKVVTKNGEAVKLEGHYDYGRIDFSERTKKY